MRDPLHDILKDLRPLIKPAPQDEYSRILERARQDKVRRQQTLWWSMSAATLAAAGLMAFLNFTPKAEPEAWLEADDISYQPEVPDRGSYQDWLWIADQVVQETGE